MGCDCSWPPGKSRPERNEPENWSADTRVLARISKMPVQNSNFKISARPDLATNLLQILIG